MRPIASSAEIVVRRIIAEDLSSYLELLSQGHGKQHQDSLRTNSVLQQAADSDGDGGT